MAAGPIEWTLSTRFRLQLHTMITCLTYCHLMIICARDSHYFHIIGDKLINPIVGVYRAHEIRIPGFPIKGEMAITTSLLFAADLSTIATLVACGGE